MHTTIKYKKLNSKAKEPTRGSNKAAGYDLYANIYKGEGYGVTIQPHTSQKIGTGLAIQPPENTFGAIFPRSGLASKQGLRPSNCVGVCDEDYTGEYIISLHNDTNEVQIVNHGDRIAQLVFIPYVSVEFNEVDELTKTDRGENGFGSTGVK